MRNRKHARGVFEFEFELPGVDVCARHIIAADSLNARAIALMASRTDRRTMTAVTVDLVMRVFSNRAHVMTGMCGHGFRFCGQIHGHHAGLSCGIQPAKHKRAEDESPPRRHKCLIFTCFRQNYPSSGVTLDSLDPAGKTGNYLGHSPQESGFRRNLPAPGDPLIEMGADMPLAAFIGKCDLFPPFLEARCAFLFQCVDTFGAGNAFPVLG